MFADETWLTKLAFPSDVFQHLSELNTDMEGRKRTLVDIVEKIAYFKCKVVVWRDKLSKGKIASFTFMNEFLEDACEVSLDDLKHVFD
jgi:hypothetical protein